MAPERDWGEDTVSLGVPDAAAHESDVESEERCEPPKGTGLGENAYWGSETVLLGSGEAGRAGSSLSAGRREPPRRRALLSAVVVAIAVLVIAVVSLMGGGGERNAQPVTPTVIRGDADRRSEDKEMRIREERRRRVEREAEAARIARARRRLRERRHNQHRATKNNVRAPEPAPASEQAPEVEPEYAPEPGPETAPPPAPSPTPPGVEFGM